MSSCQHCPRERLLKQLSLDFFAEKGLIMMLLKVGGNDWWTVITVMQSVINKKYFPEWHVYFSCWKIVSEKVCVAVTHCYISILVLRRNNLPFFKCDYLHPLSLGLQYGQQGEQCSLIQTAENVRFALLPSSSWPCLFEFILEKVKFKWFKIKE